MRLDILIQVKRMFGMPEGLYWLLRKHPDFNNLPPALFAISNSGAAAVRSWLTSQEMSQRFKY